MPSNGDYSTKKCCKGCKILTKILYEGGHRRLKNEGTTKYMLQRKKSFHGKPITKKSVKCLYKKMISPLVNAKANLREMKHVNFNNDLSLRSRPTSDRCSSHKSSNASPSNIQTNTKVNNSNNIKTIPKTHQIYLNSSVPGGDTQMPCGDSLSQNQIKSNSSKVKTENQIKNTSHKTKTENTGTTVYGTPLNSPSGLVVRNIPLMRTPSKNSLRKNTQIQSNQRCTVDNIDQLMERLDRIHNMERRAACLELYNFKEMYCKDITDETKVLSKMIQKGVSYNALRLQLDLMEAKDSTLKKISQKSSQIPSVPIKPKVHPHEKNEIKKNEEIVKCKKPVANNNNNNNNNQSKQLKIFRNYLCDIGKSHETPNEGAQVEKDPGKNKDGKLILQAQFSDGTHPLIMQYFSYPDHMKKFGVRKK